MPHSRLYFVAARELPWDYLTLNIGSEGFRCPEHISARKSPASKRISAFLGFFGLFLGIRESRRRGCSLYIVVQRNKPTITRIGCVKRGGVTGRR
jgi:hypothetical protein